MSVKITGRRERGANLPTMRYLLLVAALAVHTHGLSIASKDEKDGDVDRLGQFKTKPVRAYVNSALIVATATGAQMVSPAFVESCLGKAAAPVLEHRQLDARL